MIGATSSDFLRPIVSAIFTMSLRLLRALPRSLPRARTLHTTSSALRVSDPFPLPLSDPALAAAGSAAARERPEDVIERWDLPPPLDRTGERADVLRARLVYQTRKRGTLETDLLLSTFAREQLPNMSEDEMRQFDKLLDEPDWDIFYWAVHKRDPPARWAGTELLAKLQKHAKNEGKVVRMMPELMQREPEKL
ncbi:Succinate dehydrogenase assembly factor 2 mitochondrial [Cryptotrichosporon argae]